MSLSKRYIALLLLILVTSNFVFAQKSRRIGFDTFEAESIGSRKIYFCIDVPEKYKKVKVQNDIHAGLQNKVIYYSDSSLIYIGNNIHEGSILNFQNRLNAGYASFSKDSDLDTVKMEGIQPNGKFWREDIIGSVVIGYVNVPTEKKEQYDQALASLRREEK